MKSRTIKTIVFLVVVFLSVDIENIKAQETLGESNVYTLQQCVEISFKNNADVKLAELSSESSKINYDQSRANMLPELNAGIYHTLYNGRSINPYTNTYISQQNKAASYQLTTGITLWNGSSLHNYMKQYALNYEAGKMDAQNAKDKVTINIILNYLSVLSAQEQLNIALTKVDASQKKVDLLIIKNNDGAISPSDLYDMKGQLASDALTVVSTKNTLENAKLALAQLMNIPYSVNMKLTTIAEGVLAQPYDATVDNVYENASKRLALVKSAELKVAGAVKNIKAIKGQMIPTLSLSGGIYTNYSNAAQTQNITGTSDVITSNYVMINNVKTSVYSPQSTYNSLPITYEHQLNNNLNSAIIIGLQIPLINSLQFKNKLRQAKVEQKQLTVQAQTIRIQLRQSIEQDYVNMNSDYSTYQIMLTQVNDFEQSFHAAEVRYVDGAISTVDYVIAKNNLDRVQLNLVVAKYNYILRTKLLDFYQNRALW